MHNDNSPKAPTSDKMKAFFKSGRFWKPFIAALIGGAAGLLYYYFVGCKSGSCPITGNPYLSFIFGSLFGVFLVNSPCSGGSCQR